MRECDYCKDSDQTTPREATVSVWERDTYPLHHVGDCCDKHKRDIDTLRCEFRRIG